MDNGMQNNSEQKIDESKEERDEKRFEIIIALTLAFFAAVLAISSLLGGKYGGDELLANGLSASQYEWFNSKGIKQTLIEGQSDLLKNLLEAGAISPQLESGIKSQIEKLDKRSLKYEREKNEIKRGSSAIDSKDWVQDDKDGKFGNIVGADQYREIANGLGRACDYFDLSDLFLQISMVIGAVALVIQRKKLKSIFFILLITSGILGLIFTTVGFIYAYPFVL